MVFVDRDLHALVGLVDLDRLDLGRLERLDDEFFGIVAPLDDVDFLVVEFADDVLHPCTAHSDASADRIDFAVTAGHGDLGAHAGLAGNALQLHGSVGDFAHFQLEKLADKVRMAAGENDLRAVLAVLHRDDISAQAVADAVVFSNDALARGHDGFEFAEVENDVAFDEAADCAADDIARTVFEFLVDPLFLHATDARHDGVAGHAGGDATESGGFDLHLDAVAGLDPGLHDLGAGQKHFLLRVGYFVDDDDVGHAADFPGLRADLDAQFAGVSSESLAGSLDDGLLHGLQKGLARNPAFALQILQHSQQFVTHGRFSFEDKKKWAETHFSSEKVLLNLGKRLQSVKTCAMQGSNLRHLACEASALPLS